MLQSTVDDLHAARNANKGRLPYGKLSSVVAQLKQAGVQATRYTFRHLKPSTTTTILTTSTIPTNTIPRNITIQEDATVISDVTPPASVTPTIPSSGRPKGSTTIAKKIAEENKAACINKISEIFFHEKTKVEGALPVGYLKSLIEEKKKEFGVRDDISCNTIRTRAKRGNLAPSACGVPPPLVDAENALVVLGSPLHLQKGWRL